MLHERLWLHGPTGMSLTTVAISAAELERLREAARERDAITGALRLLTIGRDLLLENAAAFRPKLFAAKRETRATEQKNLFLSGHGTDGSYLAGSGKFPILKVVSKISEQ